MADSIGMIPLRLDEERELMGFVDRVFAHAVNTVKKIPRAAGSSRPPLADRLLVIFPRTRQGRKR